MRASISINFKDIRKRTVTREPKRGNIFNVLRRSRTSKFAAQGKHGKRGKASGAKLFNDDRELSNFPCIFRRRPHASAFGLMRLYLFPDPVSVSVSVSDAVSQLLLLRRLPMAFGVI